MKRADLRPLEWPVIAHELCTLCERVDEIIYRHTFVGWPFQLCRPCMLVWAKAPEEIANLLRDELHQKIILANTTPPTSSSN